MNQSDLFHKNAIRRHDDTSGRGNPVRIEPARVLSVDKDAWTINAQPEGDDHIITDVPLLSPYEHTDGSGIYFLPRRGAQGLLVYYDRGGPRFLCYRSEALGTGTYKGSKHDLNEGDMILKTNYGSYILLRDTGIVEVYSNEVLRSALMPYTNTWFQRAERMDISLVGGRWEWTHQRRAPDSIVDNIRNLTVTQNPGKTTLSEYYKELSNKDELLLIQQGWHDDRSIYSIDYNEGDDKRVLFKIGKIEEDLLGLGLDDLTDAGGGDDRLLLDIDDGSYTKTIGERDDGTVTRVTITGRGATNRDWKKETKVGQQSDGTVVHDRVEAGPIGNKKSVDMKIMDDGQIDLDVNDGTMTLQIDTDGNINIATDANATATITGTASVRCTDIRLEEDGQAAIGDLERAVLGDVFRSYLNDDLLQPLHDWLAGHKAIGNLGAPISPPLPNEITTLLNLIGTAAGSGRMPESNLSDRVRIEP